MVVCVCHNFNEEVIQKIIDNNPEIDVLDVHEALDCYVACGSCLPMINEMIERREDVNSG